MGEVSVASKCAGKLVWEHTCSASKDGAQLCVSQAENAWESTLDLIGLKARWLYLHGVFPLLCELADIGML